MFDGASAKKIRLKIEKKLEEVALTPELFKKLDTCPRCKGSGFLVIDKKDSMTHGINMLFPCRFCRGKK